MICFIFIEVVFVELYHNQSRKQRLPAFITF
jgi:hypothetical protein